MPDWIINAAGSYFGLKKLWDKIDGYKTYIGAVAMMLTGLSSMFGALASELNAFIAQAHDIASAFTFVQTVAHNWQTDPTAILFMGGWLAFVHGWTTMAQRHATDKATPAAPALSQTAPVPTLPTPAPAPSAPTPA